MTYWKDETPRLRAYHVCPKCGFRDRCSPFGSKKGETLMRKHSCVKCLHVWTGEVVIEEIRVRHRR